MVNQSLFPLVMSNSELAWAYSSSGFTVVALPARSYTAAISGDEALVPLTVSHGPPDFSAIELS